MILKHVDVKVAIGWARCLSTAVGLALVQDGTMTSSQSTQMIGAITMLVSLVFSARDKYIADAKLEAAKVAEPVKKDET